MVILNHTPDLEACNGTLELSCVARGRGEAAPIPSAVRCNSAAQCQSTITVNMF